ncbi:MAG: glycosyltransferase [Blastocatellia bacterium]|nr:glycosyltransferase [Blastocatellia bacterium]MCS7156862.1 glycosyltransferase [Blastocatellia bacterium]MDW8167554.1 glycosyltransferase [Acidobacteriota bacterium]MDW8256154.1 glycosyltransferase [Acidobacteriota bacterium]
MRRRGRRRLKICFISTYPPRECGIATFTYDLCHAIIENHANVHASVIAMTDTPEGYDYPPEVVFEIRHNRLSDYRLAAEYTNLSGADVLCLQHEFGIFGGQQGRYILDFLESLRKPIVTTLHTILFNPPPGYREVLTEIACASDHLVVMNSKAIPVLRDVYGVSEEKVSLIHHGVPNVPFVDPNYYKDKFGVEGRLVLLTFGLLNRNKGIEMVLEALPEVIARHPEVVYIVLGATHPVVRRKEGEEYRLWLQRRVQQLGLEEHVLFFNRYVELSELCEFIGACDIYITPYQSKEQIVSGTLAYAVGMGKAVISTPYYYAEELLAENRGRLVEFGDVAGLREALLELIENEALRHQMRKRAYEFGRQMIWSEVGAQYLTLFERISAYAPSKAVTLSLHKAFSAGYELPEIKLDHLIRLTDDTGLIQHATYGIPDRRYGYSTDDVGRALVVTLRHYHQFGDEAALSLAVRYLSFLHYAQLPNGHFHNFMDYSRRFSDNVGTEDTLGRALWGLGVAIAYSPNEGMRALAREMFERAFPQITLRHPRAIAYTICGLYNFLRRYDGAAQVRRRVAELATQLLELYAQNRAEDWLWFHEALTYGNAKIPHALLLAYRATGEEEFKKVGLESLDFLIAQTYRNDYFDFIGNQGWYRRGGERAIFSQQPIEAGYTAEACLTAFELTQEQRYLQLARAAAEWLLGRNRLGARLYDLSTGACADGLEPQGPSLNQGAESTICCMLAFLTVAQQEAQQTERRGTLSRAQLSAAVSAEERTPTFE